MRSIPTIANILVSFGVLHSGLGNEITTEILRWLRRTPVFENVFILSTGEKGLQVHGNFNLHHPLSKPGLPFDFVSVWL
jgi:hypothetical protein